VGDLAARGTRMAPERLDSPRSHPTVSRGGPGSSGQPGWEGDQPRRRPAYL